jgi:beta-N-acetylhexosaminidase
MRLVLSAALICFPLLHAATPAKKKPAPAKPTAEEAVARQWMRSLSLHDKVAQLVMVQFYGDSPNTRSKQYRDYLSLVRDVRVGGMIVLNRVQNGLVKRAEPYAMAAFLNRMQRAARLPLIVGGDFERGASMRMTGTTPFPHAMAFGKANDLEATKALGRATARESRAMGVQWVFAPVADVNNNPDNPVINIRSFSENPAVAAAHVRAFIEGAHSDPANRVLVCAKHFPGHGDTAVDSHMELPTVTAERQRLDDVELVPFRAAIEAGVDSIMTAHLVVPALETEPVPATVSKSILTGLLREELKFKGLISTDAMDMQGLSRMFKSGEAAVRALEAGVDLLLIPTDARAAVNGVLKAVETGRLTQKRIDESVLKLLTAKVRVGLNKKRFVDLEAIADQLELPEDEELALSVAAKAISIQKNDGGLVPLAKPAQACYLALTGLRGSPAGRDFFDEIRQRVKSPRLFTVDPLWSEADFDQLLEQTANCETVVAASWVTAGAYRGNVALGGNYPGFMEKLLARKIPVIFISFGNPYLLNTYPNVAAYIAAYSAAPPSEITVARKLIPAP